MSHVTSVVMEAIHDLAALAKAAPRIGCEFVRDLTHYKWYGRHVGDYPLPAGFTREDMGKCEHVIRVKGADARTYEVGVCRNPNGSGYVLLWDFYSGGYGLQAVIGADAKLLRKAYQAELTKKRMRNQGWAVRETVGADGRIIKLECTR